jgi:hypothetical protein
MRWLPAARHLTIQQRRSDLHNCSGRIWNLVVGTGPLVLFILSDAIGITKNSNPIGPGILAFFTFWPGVALTVAGSIVTLNRRRPGPGSLEWTRMVGKWPLALDARDCGFPDFRVRCGSLTCYSVCN